MSAELITQSLDLAAERCADLTPLVYQRLFRQEPQMEALFWSDRDHKVRGEMLARVIEAILDFVGDRYFAAQLIQCEVVTHAGYDVPPNVFGLFFGVVAETLAELLGPDWTPAIDAAWRQLLAELDYYVTHPDQAQTSAAA